VKLLISVNYKYNENGNYFELNETETAFQERNNNRNCCQTYNGNGNRVSSSRAW